MPSKTNLFKKSALLVALTSAFLLSPMAYAGKKDDHYGKGGKDKNFYSSFKKIKDQLDLTDEQKNKLKEMKATHGKKAMKEAHEKMDTAQKALEDALRSDASDEMVRVQFSELQKIQEEFAKARFEKVMMIRSILTSEQRAKLKSLIDK